MRDLISQKVQQNPIQLAEGQELKIFTLAQNEIEILQHNPATGYLQLRKNDKEIFEVNYRTCTSSTDRLVSLIPITAEKPNPQILKVNLAERDMISELTFDLLDGELGEIAMLKSFIKTIEESKELEAYDGIKIADIIVRLKSGKYALDKFEETCSPEFNALQDIYFNEDVRFRDQHFNRYYNKEQNSLWMREWLQRSLARYGVTDYNSLITAYHMKKHYFIFNHTNEGPCTTHFDFILDLCTHEALVLKDLAGYEALKKIFILDYFKQNKSIYYHWKKNIEYLQELVDFLSSYKDETLFSKTTMGAMANLIRGVINYELSVRRTNEETEQYRQRLLEQFFQTVHSQTASSEAQQS